MDEQKPSPSSSDSANLDPKVSALLCYLVPLVGGIVFFVISKDKYVRFHAMQSIFLSIAIGIIETLFSVTALFLSFMFIFSWLIYLGVLALWIVMMLKAYNGEKYKLPVIGDLAEKYA